MPLVFEDLLFAYGSLIYGLGVNAILAISMYIVLALGQLSLGQAAFMGVGAYTSVLLTLHLGLPFPLVLAAAAVAPALVALVIAVADPAPVGRLPGDRHHRARRGAAHPLPQHRGGRRRARHQRHSGKVELLDHLRPAHPLRRPSRAGSALQDRPGVRGDPRGRGRGPGHGHQRRPLQAGGAGRLGGASPASPARSTRTSPTPSDPTSSASSARSAS